MYGMSKSESAESEAPLAVDMKEKIREMLENEKQKLISRSSYLIGIAHIYYMNHQ